MVSAREHDDVETIARYRGVEAPTPLSLPDHCSTPWTPGSSAPNASALVHHTKAVVEDRTLLRMTNPAAPRPC